jgi:CheY-like chemotaxis protein/two-component sensor histidine kinase
MNHPERPASIERLLVPMNRQLEHMVRLIDDLLDVARISRGTLDIRKERVDLSSVLERAMETASPAFIRRNQSVELRVDERLSAQADATRIAQIVGNLLTNASKHSPEGSKVQVCLRRGDGMAIIDVVDEGAGIPPEQLEHVFGMFAKIERPGQSTNDGLGIGLALSRYLAELHGGTLTASSSGEGKGSTFTLSVPIGAAEAAVEDRPRPTQRQSSRPPAGQAGLNVVVVEDNEDSADIMSAWLQQLGHRVRVAHDGPAGVALILESRPDVVLCDIGLPGMDGVDVCRRVVDRMEDPPVMVALTGWGTEADRNRTVDAGFRHHLVKPIEPEKLRSVLRVIGAESAH